MIKLIGPLFLLFISVSSLAQNFTSFEKRELIRDKDTLRYRVQYPFNYNPEKKYPLVVFLHGSGERGSDNELQLGWGGALFADSAKRAQYPSIVIFPQCPKNDTWSRVSRTKLADSLGNFNFPAGIPIGKTLNLVEIMLDSMLSSGK